MEIIADLQIHSKYARATSKNISIENLERYARIKGLKLLGVGDFQHPLRRKEIDDKLTEDEYGILRTAGGFPFLWQTEVSLMYSQDGKRRAIHHLIFAPNKDIADSITKFLGSKGRLDYDGRPIFGMTSPELVEELKKIDDKIEIIPAHCLLPNERVICNPQIKSISKIKIGEIVLTHTGNYKKVTKTFNRNYMGKIYKVQPYYFREGINVTAEHPFLAIKTIKNCSAIGGLCKPNSASKGKHICKERHYEKYHPAWITAENLEINDVLLYPRPKDVNDIKEIKISEILSKNEFIVKSDMIYPKKGRQNKGVRNMVKITPDFCRLIGYYLAGGYAVKKNNAVQFSFAAHEEEYIKDVIKLMKDCFSIELTKKREKNGYELYFYSKVLTELFSTLFYAPNKALKAPFKMVPQWMLYLSLDKQSELFMGWWRGDTGVTTSELLVQQMKMVCLRLGIVPSIYKKTKEEHNRDERFIAGRRIFASTDVFILQNLSFFEDKFSWLEEKEFSRFKAKLQRKHGWIDHNYVYLPIKKIETFNYEGDVYNLEVEEDNSYVTPSATVHNCMTPWFGLFGSKSGFNSLQECFQDQYKKIYAIESGMSADPSMLWRFKEVSEGINVVSFSDAHSFWPWRLGREATIFEIPEFSYDNIIKAIRTGEGLKATIETPPEYGKYHWDGHRLCNFSCSPEETKKINGICPVCQKPLIIGVDNRVEEIASFPKEYKPKNAKQFYKLLPLHEVIALSIGSPLESKKTWEIYNELIKNFGSELNVLLKASKEMLLGKSFDAKLVELILSNREAKIKVAPGYDGEYGKALLGDKQSALF